MFQTVPWFYVLHSGVDNWEGSSIKVNMDDNFTVSCAPNPTSIIYPDGILTSTIRLNNSQYLWLDCL